MPVAYHDTVYPRLHREILELTIKPGTLISENALCARFGVSRTPVRAALQRLREKELVEIVPHKGSFVTRLRFDIVDQIIYLRVAVESMVLRDFARSCTQAQLEQAWAIHHQMEEEAARPQPSSGRFFQLDCALHETWFRAMNKMFLWEGIQREQADYSRFRMLDIVEAHNMPDVLAEHRELLRILSEKDLPAVEPLMRKHLYGGVRRLGSKLFEEFGDYFVPQG